MNPTPIAPTSTGPFTGPRFNLEIQLTREESAHLFAGKVVVIEAGAGKRVPGPFDDDTTHLILPEWKARLFDGSLARIKASYPDNNHMELRAWWVDERDPTTEKRALDRALGNPTSSGAIVNS